MKVSRRDVSSAYRKTQGDEAAFKRCLRGLQARWNSISAPAPRRACLDSTLLLELAD